MDPVAIISDIHGNLPAFTTNLKEIDRLEINRILSLGDTVGYGPQPVECLQLAQKRCDVVLMGNHEATILNSRSSNMNPNASKAIEWTKKRLNEKNMFQGLIELPFFHREEGFLFVHGTPRDILLDYLTKERGRNNLNKDASRLQGIFVRSSISKSSK